MTLEEREEEKRLSIMSEEVGMKLQLWTGGLEWKGILDYLLDTSINIVDLPFMER